MNDKERSKIISEEYADLIIGYYGNVSELDKFSTDAITLFDEKHAFVYIPREKITKSSLSEYGYQPFPSCFALMSTLSLETSGVIKIRNLPKFGLRGQGVLVGFVDTGIDYTHKAFRNTDGSSRIRSIWDQTIDSTKYPKDFYYGTEYIKADINHALESDNPFEIVPSKDEIGHGTMLAGITAGSELPENDFSGVVPGAELIIVKLKQAKQYIRDFFAIPSESICYQETDILMGIKYILSIANQLRRPIVICVGLGTSQGAHDERGILSSYLSMVSDITGVAVVIAAGNEGNTRSHFYGVVDSTLGYKTVELNVAKGECCFSMELWGFAPATFSIDILSPTGEYIPTIQARLGENREIKFLLEETIVWIDYRIIEIQTGDQLIIVRFQKPTEGIWRFKVYEKENLNLGFHIWLPTLPFISENTYFLESDPYTTLTSPANTIVSIVATAYNPVDQSLYLNASKGYTRTDTIKPDIAAPGVNVVCPVPNNDFGTGTGTGVAAAHTAGIAAMLFEWGIVRGNFTTMDSMDINILLSRGAKRKPDIIYPNREWGYGIIDVFGTFESLKR